MTDARPLARWAGAHFQALGLSLLFITLATATFWFVAFFVPGQRQAAIDSWRRDLDVRAEIRKEALQRYFIDGLADAETLAAYPTALQALAMRSAGVAGPVADAGVPDAHLEELFGDFVRIHGVLGVVLWDADGKPCVKSRDLVLEAASPTPAREVLASGSPAAGFHLHTALGAILTFSAPVRFANGDVRGAVVVAVDPREWLYPLLAQPLAGTSTGEALLVGRDGADALFLSPLRHRPDAPLSFRRPLGDPGFAARSALEGPLTAGPYVDYRGVRILAAARRVPPSPWALVVKVDEDEALAGFRARMRRTAFGWTATLIAVLGVGWGLTQRRERVHAAAIAQSDARIRQLNRLLKTISEINQAIVHIDDRKTLLTEACRILVEHGGFRMAWVGFAEAASGRVVPEARAGEGLDFLDGVTDRFDDPPGGHGPVGAAIRTGRSVLIADLAMDPAFAPWSERHRAHGLRSAGSFPLRVRGETTGALTVYRGDPFVFDDEETTLLEELAGDIGYALEAMEDRAERRKAEEALRDSEERFRLAAESAADVIYEWDLGTSIQWFGKVDELMGYAPGEFPRTMEGWAALVHPEDRERVSAAIDLQLKGEVPYDVEYRVRKKDGTYGYWWARGSVPTDATGKPYRWIGSVTDVTERKLAETVLRESEARYKTLLENIPQGIFMKSGTFRYVSVNENYARDLGIRPEDVVGKVDYDLFPKEHADKYRADDKRVMETAQTEEFEEQYVQGGREKWIHTIKTPVRDRNGEIIGVLGVFWDITERKRADEALRESEAKLRGLTEELESRVETRTAELKAANRELEAFSYSVSHDLRAPLRAVDGFSRILLSDHAEQLDSEGKRLLDVVRSNTRQMGQLIDDLLSFSRIGRQEIERTAVDMKALAHAAFSDLLSADERVSFTVGELPHADVDPSLMRQVWTNLISNSLKFTRPKAERVIEIAGRAEPGRVVYSVKDNGVGFDMAYADKLFGVFQRLHSSHEFEGTGVGLALVQRIVHRHGGEVWADGKVGEGATFSFSLPRPGGPP